MTPLQGFIPGGEGRDWRAWGDAGEQGPRQAEALPPLQGSTVSTAIVRQSGGGGINILTEAQAWLYYFLLTRELPKYGSAEMPKQYKDTDFCVDFS